MATPCPISHFPSRFERGSGFPQFAQHTYDRASGEFDLETVMAESSCACKLSVGGLAKRFHARLRTRQHLLCFVSTPRLRCNATQGQAHAEYSSVAYIERGRDAHQSKRIARAVADLAVQRSFRECKRRQIDGDDQLIGFENCFDVRSIARQQVKLVERNRSCTPRSCNLQGCIHGRKRDAHIRRMCGDTTVRYTQDP